MEQEEVVIDPTNDTFTLKLGESHPDQETEEEKEENATPGSTSTTKKWVPRALKYGGALGFSIAVLYALYAV